MAPYRVRIVRIRLEHVDVVVQAATDDEAYALAQEAALTLAPAQWRSLSVKPNRRWPLIGGRGGVKARAMIGVVEDGEVDLTAVDGSRDIPKDLTDRFVERTFASLGSKAHNELQARSDRSIEATLAMISAWPNRPVTGKASKMKRRTSINGN